MANGHGGGRPGSGRKPKSEVARSLDGGAGHRAKVLAHPSAPVDPPPPVLPQLDESDCPNELTHEERLIWLELAPHAKLNRTLTESTSLGFRMLCKNIALSNRYYASVLDCGGPNHRGLIQRIDAELLRFSLAPCGKPVAPAAVEVPAVDPVKARYFGRR